MRDFACVVFWNYFEIRTKSLLLHWLELNVKMSGRGRPRIRYLIDHSAKNDKPEVEKLWQHTFLASYTSEYPCIVTSLAWHPILWRCTSCEDEHIFNLLDNELKQHEIPCKILLALVIDNANVMTGDKGVMLKGNMKTFIWQGACVTCYIWLWNEGSKAPANLTWMTLFTEWIGWKVQIDSRSSKYFSMNAVWKNTSC